MYFSHIHIACTLLSYPDVFINCSLYCLYFSNQPIAACFFATFWLLENMQENIQKVFVVKMCFSHIVYISYWQQTVWMNHTVGCVSALPGHMLWGAPGPTQALSVGKGKHTYICLGGSSVKVAPLGWSMDPVMLTWGRGRPRQLSGDDCWNNQQDSQLTLRVTNLPIFEPTRQSTMIRVYICILNMWCVLMK